MAPPVSTTTSTEVPGRLPVAIGGHAYLLDPAGFERTSIPALREQADTGDEPGERSLNPRGLWRRSQETYHHGAGQLFLDGKDADRSRFRASKGIDPWTEGKITLLNETVRLRASTNTNLSLLIARWGSADFVWITDGNEVYSNAEPINLLSDNQGTLGTDTAGWAAGANTTMSRSADTFDAVAGSLELTRTAGSGTVSANTPTGTLGIPVTPLRQYNLIVVKRLVSGTTTAVFNPYVDWYNSAGALISSAPATPPNFTLTTSWSAATPGSASFVAPVGAAYASVRLEVTGAAAVDVFRFDAIRFILGATFPSNAYWSNRDIHAGQAAQTPTSMATDGYYVWVALGISGIHRAYGTGIAAVVDVPAAPGGGNIGLVSYVNGRLMAAGSAISTTDRNTVWEVVNPLSAPALGNGTLGMLWTHPNTSFVVTLISSGRNCLYIGGNVGGNAEVYRVTINPTDTSLTTPTFATYLPDGETIHALQFYAGGVVMGTSRGIRTATVDGQGNLDYGPLISTTSPVRALEPQGRYVWFEMTNYDSISTGLGRIDLGYFPSALVPAWASDLMVTGQGVVSSVVTLLPRTSVLPIEQRMFAVQGLGFYGENTQKVALGTIETGGIRYSTTERKTTRTVDFRHHVLDGTVAVDIKVDEGAYASVGSNTTQGSAGPLSPLSTANAEGETAELRFTLSRPTNGRAITLATTINSTTATSSDASFTAADVGRGVVDYNSVVRLAEGSRVASVTNSTTVELNKAAVITSAAAPAVLSSPLLAPDLVRWTLKALPIPRRDEIFTLPLIMHSYVDSTNGDGARTPQDVLSEISFLKGLERAGTIVKLQVSSEIHDVFIDAISQQGMHWVDWAGTKVLQGTVVVRAQSVEG